jgi:Lrp/AsnC family transcriptional regulator, leucine-responsive regulatory protein
MVAIKFKPSSIDLKLLEILQKDADLPMAKIADDVGLSAPACYRRIRMLRAAGLIHRTAAVVDRKTMGWPLHMVVLVTLEKERAAVIDKLFQHIKRTPQIIEAHYVAGDYDFVLKVVASDMESFDELMRHVLYESGIVRTFKTLVTVREVKQGSSIPNAARSSLFA